MCHARQVPWKRPAPAWTEPERRAHFAASSAVVGLAATACTVLVPGVFILLARQRNGGGFVAFAVGFAAFPVLAFFALVVGPVAAIVGLRLWRRARSAADSGALVHIALILNGLGFAWWLWLASAYLLELVGVRA